MKANETTLADLISVNKRVFSIPVYQRNYDWKQEHCKQLFLDLESIAFTQLDHFLGTIVYIQDRSTATNPYFILIDGQQRITSVMLLIKALHDLTDDQDVKDDIRDSFLKNTRGNNPYRLKLKPIESDKTIYEKLVEMDDFDENLFSIDEKKTNIYKNYQYFKSMIQSSKANPKDLYEAVYKIEIVEIALDKENPQAIFESLNSTGLDLTNTDLLRNYLLMSLPYDVQEKLYKKYWMQIEKIIGNDNLEQFMLVYLMFKKRSNATQTNNRKAIISKRNLYESFKKYFTEELTGESVENRLKDMLKYAGYYRLFIYDDDRHPNNKIEEKLYEIFYELECQPAAILLLYFFDLLDNGHIYETELLEILDIFISYIFRARICGKNTTAQLFALLINKIDNESSENSIVDKTWKSFISGKGSYAFPSNKEFKNELQVRDIYVTLKSAGTRYMFYKYEGTLSKEIVAQENSTIEHILPQTITDEWKQYLNNNQDNTYEQYIHKLGNLTLTKVNSKLSNKIFSKKKEEYEESNYKLTRQLSRYNNWTSKEIQMRTRELADLALKIWGLPERYNLEVPDSSDTFASLDDDINSFIGTRPEMVSFENDCINCNNWITVSNFIITKLYSLDKEIFKSLAVTSFNRKNTIFSSNKNNLKNPEMLDSDLYFDISTYKNTKNLLNTLLFIIDTFEAETNMAYGDISSKVELILRK